MMPSLQPIMPAENTVRLIIANDHHFNKYIEALMLMHDLLCGYALTASEPYFGEEEIRARMTYLAGENMGQANMSYNLPQDEYHIYVNYAFADWEIAKSIVQRLHEARFKTRVLMPFTEQITSEAEYDAIINEWHNARRNSHVMVIILTEKAKKSAEEGRGVADDLDYALQHGMRIFPILWGITQEVTPYQLRFIPAYKTDRWLGKGFDELLKDLRQHFDSMELDTTNLPEEIQKNIRQNYGQAQQLRFAAESQIFMQLETDNPYDPREAITHFLSGLVQIYSTLRMLRQGPNFG